MQTDIETNKQKVSSLLHTYDKRTCLQSNSIKHKKYN